MLVKSVLVRPQGLHPRARAPTCPLLATPLDEGAKMYTKATPSASLRGEQEAVRPIFWVIFNSSYF